MIQAIRVQGIPEVCIALHIYVRLVIIPFYFRYFKTTWVKYKVFGSDLWFFVRFFLFLTVIHLSIINFGSLQLHRASMLMTWSLTIISFAVIFIDLDGWASPYPHEIFGIVTTIICFIQPIIAMFRPNISSPKRKYFNLAHISCGTMAFGLAGSSYFLTIT